MKRMTRTLAIALIALMLLSSVAALAAGKVKTTGNVNMRTGAGLQYKIIRTISKGTSLNYDKTAKDGRGVMWYHVTYNGKTGWVSSRYATEGEAGTSASGKVKTTGSVNLRSGAGLSYQSLKVIPKGVSLSYVAKQKDGRGVVWYRVTYQGITGWVSSRYAK